MKESSSESSKIDICSPLHKRPKRHENDEEKSELTKSTHYNVTTNGTSSEQTTEPNSEVLPTTQTSKQVSKATKQSKQVSNATKQRQQTPKNTKSSKKETTVEDFDMDLPEIDGMASHIGQENDYGNIEYKWRLLNVSAERLDHLTTQMNFRLNEGLGECFYHIGVEDDGNPKGLPEIDLRKTLAVLKQICKNLGADMNVVCRRKGIQGEVAEVLMRQTSEDDFVDIRVCVCGSEGSGKSTLIGVMTRGKLDNGKGSARMDVFQHPHEVECGLTSAISQHILGFDNKGKVTNYSLFHKGVWPEIVKASSKVVTFTDLAGHERYSRTTTFGLTGQRPDYVMLVISLAIGITDVTCDHVGTALGLDIPVFVCLTNYDTSRNLTKIHKELEEMFSAENRQMCILESKSSVSANTKSFVSGSVVPVFAVSSVSGEGLPLLKFFLNLVPKHPSWAKALTEPAEMQITDIFDVSTAGIVIQGTVLRGSISVDDQLILGPDDEGNFRKTSILSIHVKHRNVKYCAAGQVASFCVKKEARESVRRGMVLLSADVSPISSFTFEVLLGVSSNPNECRTNFQPLLHIGTIRQAASMIYIENGTISSGERSLVRFQFLHRPEYVHIGDHVVFREGFTKGIGKVTAINLHPKATISLERQEDPKNGRVRKNSISRQER
eukprot:1012045_1